MRLTYFFFVVSFAFLSLEASALSYPAVANVSSVLEDSTAKAVVVAAPNVEPRQRSAFFERLKNKIAGIFKNPTTVNGKTSTKSTLGWIALGATGLGIILLFAGTGSVGGILLLGGILTGLVALVMPRSKEEKAAKKKRNTGAIIAVALGVGLIIIVAASLSNWK